MEITNYTMGVSKVYGLVKGGGDRLITSRSCACSKDKLIGDSYPDAGYKIF